MPAWGACKNIGVIHPAFFLKAGFNIGEINALDSWVDRIIMKKVHPCFGTAFAPKAGHHVRTQYAYYDYRKAYRKIEPATGQPAACTFAVQAFINRKTKRNKQYEVARRLPVKVVLEVGP